MKTIEQYNAKLKKSNFKIVRFFPQPQKAFFSIVKVSEHCNWLDRLLGDDVVDTVITTKDYRALSIRAEDILAGRSTSFVRI